MRSALALLLLLAPLAASAGPFDVAHHHGGDDEGEDQAIKITGLLDLRYAYTSAGQSWLLGGPNKLRYGGKDTTGDGRGDRAGSVFAVSQASLVLDAPVPQGAQVHVQLNVDADPDVPDPSAGIVEAYARAEGESSAGKGAVRAGALIPPVSWENWENAWSTHYTVTPSAIASWVGEDLRVYGAEGTVERGFGDQAVRLTGAAFGGGDNAGWILLNRGWALTDYQSKLNSALPLPDGTQDQPFRELDGRVGYYGRLNVALFNSLIKLGGGYWDNNGDPKTQFKQGPAATTTETAFHTKFYDAGAKLDWRGLSVLAQTLEGDTQGVNDPRRSWRAAYALAAYHLPHHVTVSGRYDKFWVQKWEKGHASTADLQWDFSPRQRLSAEYIEVASHPSVELRPGGEIDHLFQLNWRLKFGA